MIFFSTFSRFAFAFYFLLWSNIVKPTHAQESPNLTPPCPHQPYTVHIFSRNPLMIYIENFVSLKEASHLIALAEPHYTLSGVYQAPDSPNAEEPLLLSNSLNFTARSSQSAYIYQDHIADCISSRAASFQGILPSHLEPLQVVKYEKTEQFMFHQDSLCHLEGGGWRVEDCRTLGDRETTFFVYLKSEGVVGGETQFLNLQRDQLIAGRHRDNWCQFLDCGDENGGESLKWLPKEGNALFWENLDKEGKAMESVVHAVLPVREGQKIGLNIWTREREVI